MRISTLHTLYVHPSGIPDPVCFDAVARSIFVITSAQQEAQAQLSAWEHERTRLRDEAQQWAARYHESRAKLERFSEEAAQISKEAIQRAAHMDVMREKAFIMQEASPQTLETRETL